MLFYVVSQTSTIFLEIGFPGPDDFIEVDQYVDGIWHYAWDAGIVPFASAAIGFKVLMWFLVAAKGE